MPAAGRRTPGLTIPVLLVGLGRYMSAFCIALRSFPQEASGSLCNQTLSMVLQRFFTSSGWLTSILLSSALVRLSSSPISLHFMAYSSMNSLERYTSVGFNSKNTQ